MRKIARVGMLAVALAAIPTVQAANQEQKAAASKLAPVSLPTVDQILDKYVRALGGKSAIEKLTSRVSKGTFDIPALGVIGSFEAYAKAPNKSASVVDIPSFGQIRQGFDGKVGWAGNPQQGLRELSGQELGTAMRSAEFHQVLKFHQLYAKMTVKGAEKVGERDTYVIEADPGDGSLRRMYFDSLTGLLVRNVIERDGPQGRLTFESYPEDYREVGGIKVPFVLRQNNPDVSFVITMTEIQHNVPVDDARFSKAGSN
jgi:zinc protease